MATIRKRGGKLHLHFYLQRQRCREATGLDDTPANRRRLRVLLKQIEVEIALGTFDYAKYFPNSRNAARMQLLGAQGAGAATMPFSQLALAWFEQQGTDRKETTQTSAQSALNRHIIPFFGDRPVSDISRNDILQFKTQLAKHQFNGRTLSDSRISHIMSNLKAILAEGEQRYKGFASPYKNIGRVRRQASPLKPSKPFSLEEVMTLIRTIRPDFRNYLTVRFFAGMRPSEIDGLHWDDIDFERRQINVHRAWVEGKFVTTKTPKSSRSISMASMVFDALLEQRKVTGAQGGFVFLSAQGKPIHRRNFLRRVWNPLLMHLGYELRVPYQTRHTTASLWLASGESPEWIARQLGHSNTEMLFRTYSRYVPNMTRNDGSAFERMLEKAAEAGPKPGDNDTQQGK